MGRFTDKLIKSWIKKGEHFEMRSDGEGLSLCFRENFATPVWRLRYRIGGRQTVIVLGSYRNMSLAEARAEAKKLRASVELGFDVGLGACPRIASSRPPKFNTGYFCQSLPGIRTLNNSIKYNSL